jgi:hypothetical protein
MEQFKNVTLDTFIARGTQLNILYNSGNKNPFKVPAVEKN